MKPIAVSAVIKFPVSTEKAIRLMEAENILLFAVDKHADKALIKKAVESNFQAKVLRVRTLINKNNEKIAYVKFAKTTPAIDVATKLGLV